MESAMEDSSAVIEGVIRLERMRMAYLRACCCWIEFVVLMVLLGFEIEVGVGVEVEEDWESG